MRSRILALFWILGILFPVASLGNHWPPFGRVFNAVFTPGWTHIAMHAFLYLVLAFLLTRWIGPVSVKAMLLLLGLVLVIAACQEGLQWRTVKSEIGWSASAFDLAVDLAGTFAGLALARLWSSRRRGVAMKQE
jgi:VanZ family protein